MATERQSTENLIEEAKALHPEWSFYPSTQRIKKVMFDVPVSAIDAVTETVNLWEVADKVYNSPLVQVRAIIPSSFQDNLLSLVDKFKCSGSLSSQAKFDVVGRIPFRSDNEDYGIYYIQLESETRKGYKDEKHIEHTQALQIALKKKEKHTVRLIPEGYKIHTIIFLDNQAIDVLTGEKLSFNQEELARQIIEVHKEAFKEDTHDPNQRSMEGALGIIRNNPTLVAIDNENSVCSVGYMEREDRFTFGNISLIEPTYFTHPTKDGLGLSSALRQITRRITSGQTEVPIYNNSPMIVFNESIRHTSFLLCIANGCELAGTNDLSIPGNLGEAYTRIGPANPDLGRGYMPMGLTYFINPRIEVK